MFKRLALFASSVILVALTVPAQAHYVPSLSGYAWHSIGCDITLSGVQSDNTRLAKVACSVEPTFIYVACQNPQGKLKPGKAYLKGSLTSETGIYDNKVDNNGRWSDTIYLTNKYLSDNFEIQCDLNKWTPYQITDDGVTYYNWVLVGAFNSKMNTYVCYYSAYNCDPTQAYDPLTGAPNTAAGWDLYSQVVATDCSLPQVKPDYSPTNMPAANTPYNCNTLEYKHLI